jgi:ferredoxin
MGVAAFTTYGGPGDGQYNAALNILAGLTDKGGVPLGLDTFGNMSTYPPTWSMGNGGRVLKYRHKPDKATYAQVSAFASEVLEQYESGRGIEVKTQPSVTSLFKGGVSRSMSKVMLGKHYIDTERCIRCEICVDTCPVGAITLTPPAINTDRCLLCFGCINNCPREAHVMTAMGKHIYGFPEFLRRNGLYILPPPI